MKQAKHYKKLDNQMVNCALCPWNCMIKPGKQGMCGVRQNLKGTLYAAVYARPCALHTDPIEKKPLYHFLPGKQAFSIATIGCNFFCEFCQNWQISRADLKSIDNDYKKLSPEQALKLCEQNNCQAMSYTYTEPTIFYEYMLDMAVLARKQGIRNTMVSNGYINEEPLRELCRYMDAANIDLKAFNNEFYQKICKGKLEPVLKTLKILKQEGVWLEITNLIVPGENDDMKEIKEMCRWISRELGRDTPLHFSRFHPDYNMDSKEPTPIETMEKAEEIANKYLDFVYLGNLGRESNTLCPECREVVVKRSAFGTEVLARNGKCPECGKTIAGVWN